VESRYGGERAEGEYGKNKGHRCSDVVGQVVKESTHVEFVVRELAQTLSNAQCQALIHKKCSGVTGKLKHVDDYRCA